MGTLGLNLAEQLARLDTTTPTSIDVEDALISGANPEDLPEEDNLAAREHYLEVGVSSLRKDLDSISDPKYDGVKISRERLVEDIDEKGTEDEPEEQYLDVTTFWDTPTSPSPSDSLPEVRHARLKPLQASGTKTIEDFEDVSSTLQKARNIDQEKGKAVIRQISIWDSLLDARIRLQKAAMATNRLPVGKRLEESQKYRSSIENLSREAVLLSGDLFELQEFLLSKNDSVVLPARKKRRLSMDTSIPITERHSWLQAATHEASMSEKTCHAFFVQTLSKWSSKIQAVTPSVLLPTKSGAFSSKNGQNVKSAVQLVDEALLEPRSMNRTRVYRGKSPRLGIPSEEEEGKEEVELFDDTDFYQQLLRDVIDSRGSGNTPRDDWMAMQKQKKAKKKVDTKASKGRKLRYDVHEKLQNFMVPVPVQGGWHEEQIDELFASLLGKGMQLQSSSNEVNAKQGTSQNIPTDRVVTAGFRLFG